MADGDHDLESIRRRVEQGRAFTSDSKALLRIIDHLQQSENIEASTLLDHVNQVLTEVEAIAAEGRTDAVEGPATIGGIRSALAKDIAMKLRRVLDGKDPLP